MNFWKFIWKWILPQQFINQKCFYDGINLLLGKKADKETISSKLTTFLLPKVFTRSITAKYSLLKHNSICKSTVFLSQEQP